MELTNEVLDIMRGLDSCTYNHCYRMWWIARGQEADFGRKDDSYSTAAFIHDIGKIYVPVCILDKREGLTSLEREIVELHPYFGYRLLDAAGVDERLKRLALYHHGMEPRMLTVLPEFDSASVEEDAKMLRTLDVFEALTSDRPYKRRKSVEETYSLMTDEGGFHKETLEYLRENVANF